MSTSIPLQSSSSRKYTSRSGLHLVALLITGLAAATLTAAQTPTNPSATTPPNPSSTTALPKKPLHSSKHHASAKKPEQPTAPVTPPPPPVPAWPVNDKPNPASVSWDSRGLRIEATNSSLQQILSEVATETGAKVEGMGADQRVYGAYGPGQARDVILQLMQGSGYNVLLAGDLGAGAPREIVLSLRHSGGNTPGAANRPGQDAGDEDVPDEVEEQQPPPPPPPQPTSGRPGLGPGGPVRTPQQVMEEMQQRQLQQQQQQPQQPQPNPPQN